MTVEAALIRTEIPGLPLLARGKVRDIYDAGPEHLLIVATDRLSAFDVVLPDGIPGKGRVLTELSVFWFALLEGVVENHLVSANLEDLPEPARRQGALLEGRTMLVKKARPFPVECIARGYLTGSGLKDYRATGRVCGVVLPPDLGEAARLEPPIFTPSTKAQRGIHDENISYATVERVVGSEAAAWLRDTTLDVYATARVHAEARGILIADTKLEFGTLPDGRRILIDEVLTPDSSRFWNAADWAPGRTPPSYDKQVVRDYLLTLDWDRTPPGPRLPTEVLEAAARRYEEIAARLRS